MAFKSGKPRKSFDPLSEEPFKVSRTKIDLFIECPRCFYLDQRLGVKRPDTYPLTLNIAVDALLKKEFDIHRARGSAHPMMDKYGINAIPLKHENINLWRELDFGRGGIHFLHQDTNFDVYGVVDDIWVNPEKEFIVVDYKATAKRDTPTLEGDLGAQYKRQMEVYQWLLRRNGFQVSETGYFLYVNGKKDVEAFDAKLEFDITILPCKGDDSWIEKTLYSIKKCLVADKIPEAGERCGYCPYRQAAGEAIREIFKANRPAPKNSRTKESEDEKTESLF